MACVHVITAFWLSMPGQQRQLVCPHIVVASSALISANGSGASSGSGGGGVGEGEGGAPAPAAPALLQRVVQVVAQAVAMEAASDMVGQGIPVAAARLVMRVAVGQAPVGPAAAAPLLGVACLPSTRWPRHCLPARAGTSMQQPRQQQLRVQRRQ